MSRVPSFQRIALSLCLAAVFVLCGARSAHASPGPGDDRLVSTPTAWWMYNNISGSDLSTKLNDNHARLTDLRVVSTSPLLFSAVMVANSGVYSSGWWWYYGVTEAEVNNHLSANNARPISIQGYASGSSTHFAVVMVSNTGSAHRNWAWYYGTSSFIKDSRPSGYRPIMLGNYINSSGDRNYTTIFVENTEGYTWGWYFNVTSSTIASLLNPYNSLIDASANDNDAMGINIVFYENLPTPHGVVQGTTYYTISVGDMVSKALADDARPLFLTQYTLHGSGTYDGYTQYLSSRRDNY